MVGSYMLSTLYKAYSRLAPDVAYSSLSPVIDSPVAGQDDNGVVESWLPVTDSQSADFLF
jgi:hypothetical protein